MKIVSWNVNGIVSCRRKGFLKFVTDSKADVVCCQEVRTECALKTPGYFQIWNPAKRKGYAGTMVLARRQPLSYTTTLGDESLDEEGRFISLEYADYHIITVYFPNIFGDPARRDYRLAWEAGLRSYVEKLSKPAIICGDFNVGHEVVDIYPENERSRKPADDLFDYTPEMRESFDKLLALGFADAFRSLYPQKRDAYTWWAPKNNNRAENRGSRLDYFLVTDELLGLIRSIHHHTEIQGSDHCPISMTISSVQKRTDMSDEDFGVMWRSIDWLKMEHELEQAQTELAQAAFEMRWDSVAALQDKLVRSFAARVLAVRTVVNNNSQAGVDGVKWKDDAEKMRAAFSLVPRGYRPLPFRYQEIVDRGRVRVMLIPAAKDKAMLTLYAYALDPVAESIADKRSFSMRKGRSALDAHAYLCRDLSGPDAAEWADKIDVWAFYENIVHQVLLNTVPMDRKMLKKFLRPGFIKDGELFQKAKGISFASSLSPILGNLLLDGVQSYIYDRLYPNGNVDYKGGSVTRFADDIIVTARTREQAEQILGIVSEFLAIRGLHVNPDKTCIVNMSDGFDYLGRHYQRKQGTLVVGPSEASVKKCEQDLKELIDNYKGTQRTLIERINSKLTGWAAYHRVTDAYMEFRHIDAVVEGLLIDRMCSRYPRWHRETILERYWIKEGQHYTFALPTDPSVRVVRLATVGTVEHRPCSLSFNPYLDKAYFAWLQRRREIQKASGKYHPVWQRQEGKCAFCGQPMLADQEIDLIERNIGEGHRIKNLLYIHKQCGYDIFAGEEEADTQESIDLFEMLGHTAESAPKKDSPYMELTEFFRTCERTPVTLTFREIEQILGDQLDWEARCYQAFWYDDGSDFSKTIWRAEGFPEDVFKPSNSQYNIAESWLSQGYQIKALHMESERVVFRRVNEKNIGWNPPKALTEKKIPEIAAYKLNQYSHRIIREYGL